MAARSETGSALEILGVDIGGSAIKAAPVDISTGILTAARARMPTPAESTPAALMEILRQTIEGFSWTGPIGCAFPGPVVDGIVQTAVNLHNSWVGLDSVEATRSALGREIALVNDADAAGIAEVRLGAAKGRTDTVVVLTFGTGIGSALFTGGTLVPNTELGEVRLGEETAETYASARTRAQLELTYDIWAARVSKVLGLYEEILYPGLFVIGGGISSAWSQFSPHLSCRTPVVRARFGEDAGIVGAALCAGDHVTE